VALHNKLSAKLITEAEAIVLAEKSGRRFGERRRVGKQFPHFPTGTGSIRSA
jgi:hypothetical protein